MAAAAMVTDNKCTEITPYMLPPVVNFPSKENSILSNGCHFMFIPYVTILMADPGCLVKHFGSV